MQQPIAPATAGATGGRHLAGEFVLESGYSDRLANADLVPLKKQTWTAYNIFAFWMSDVHSVGGYIFAGSLFALGLTSWQVLVALLAGISIVNVFCNLVAKPSQVNGVPYPVMCRATFGVLGANVPAMIRGLIAVAWYGIQTYLASTAFVILMLKFVPHWAPYADVATHGFVGLSVLGWAGFLILWVLQALVFWNGMEAIKKFIDFAGPAVYLVMFLLTAWLVSKAGWQNVHLDLSAVKYHGWDVVPVMITAISLVVSYFSGPMLNFGDFSRYGKSFEAVKRGNFWGLPVNFLAFSLVTVVTTSATLPVFGKMITDPVTMVGQIDNATAVVLGTLTFVIATIGINIVANFVSPAFDFSNIAPSKISWRMGGMIAAVASIFITPWNLFNRPEVIHYTLDVLGSFIGPLYGVLIVDYYLVKRQTTSLHDMFSMSPAGRYWYQNGVNRKALYALAPAAVIAILCVVVPALHGLANFSWFIGVAFSAAFYWLLARGEAAAAVRVGPRTRVKLKLVNPNTTRSMTDAMGACARRVAGAGTEIVAVSPAMGPPSVEGWYDEALCVPGLLAEIAAGEREGCDGYIIACFGDPGLYAARELARGPVIGIAEAAMHAASMIAPSFAIVTTLGRTRGMAQHLVERYGMGHVCRSVRATELAVLDLERPGSHAQRAIIAECRQAIDENGAEAIVLGCAGMAELCRTIEDALGVPVVDGVTAAVKFAESLVTLGLRTAKRGEFARPLPKEYSGMLRGFSPADEMPAAEQPVTVAAQSLTRV